MIAKTKSTDQLGTYHIAQHPELYTPSRSNNFVFYPLFDKRLLRAGVNPETATDNDYISADKAQEVLMLSVSGAAVPHPTQTVVEVKRGNTVVKFPGAWTYEAGSFVFEDYIGAETKEVLMAWRALSGNLHDETVGSKANCTFNGILVEYTPDHRQIRHWDFYGCWINQLSEGDFSSEDDGKRQVTATIQYDRALPGLPDDAEEVTFTSQSTAE